MTAGGRPANVSMPVKVIGPNDVQTIQLSTEDAETIIELHDEAFGIMVDPDITFFRRIKPDPSSDLNVNGIVDGMDLLDVTFALQHPTPGLDWTDVADVNQDGVTDSRDVDLVVQSFGLINDASGP